jgi:ADP-ribose pyrophosphatase YjhB (NUDIX family)
MTTRKNAHCSYCGQLFPLDQAWPRQCASCSNITYLNPLPVAVAVVPVDAGVLCIRRTIPPAIGKLAFPGGFLEVGETWQEGCARELREETGLVIDPGEVQLFRAYSAAREGLLLLFGLVVPRTADDLPAFVANDEVGELQVISRLEELAFPLHTHVLSEFFAHRGR